MTGGNTGGAGLLGVVIATVLLNYTLKRLRLRRLEISLGEEMGQFLSYVATVVLVWAVMGLLALVPGVGPYLGWDWMPAFMQRLTPADPIGTVLGLVFCLSCLFGFTLSAYVLTYDKVLLAHCHSAFPFSMSGRLTSALASFYLSTVVLDLLRAGFSTGGTAQLTLGSAVTAFMYVVAIVAAPLVDASLRRRGVAGFRGFSVLQVVVVVLLGSITGSLLYRGSVHLGSLVYAEFFRSLMASVAGILIFSAGLLLFGIAVLRTWPSTATRRIIRPSVRPTPTPATLSATGWRRYDKATGRRIHLP